MATERETIQAMARHLTDLAQILVEWVTEGPASPEAPPVMSLPPYAQVIARQDSNWACPEHRTSKQVPAGVSKSTGRAYDAFIVCAERGCEQRPPRAAAALPQRAMPPRPARLP